MNREPSQTALTLLEVVLTIAILGFLSVLTFDFFYRSVEIYNAARENNRLLQADRNALWRLSRDARGARSGNIAGGRLNLYNTQTTPLDDATELTYKLDGENFQRQRVTATNPSIDLMAQQVTGFEPSIANQYLSVTLRLLDEEGGEMELITGVSFYNDESRFGGDWKELVTVE